MTLEEIDNLSGRRLDAAVAQFVMGWIVGEIHGDWMGNPEGGEGGCKIVPSFWCKPNDTMKVITRMIDLEFGYSADFSEARGWYASFIQPHGAAGASAGATMMEATARAALKAMTMVAEDAREIAERLAGSPPDNADSGRGVRP